MTSYRNGLKTALLLGTLSALILLIGAQAGNSGLVLALVVALGMNAWAYFHSDRLALRSMHAYPVAPHEAPWLHAVVAELSREMGIPTPRLYLSPTASPNAFATGRSPEHAAVCVTEGILEILDERELRAVLAHELAHVGNRDILISSVAAALASVVTFLAQIGQLSMVFGQHEDDEGGGPSHLLLVVLGPLAAGLIQLAVSRSREFEADATGAMISGDPLSLARALAKLERGTRLRPLPEDASLAPTSSLMITNPFRGGVGALFSTHPPTSERIARLEQLAAAGAARVRGRSLVRI